MEKYAQYKAQIEATLLNLDLKDNPQGLYEPIAYILSLGGKRLRPVLTLAACDLFGGNTKAALPAACGLEIFHNFTLLHDDIMDEAPTRRGMETVHKKWNANAAILSGDTMLALAYRQIHTSPGIKNISEILNVFSQTAIEVCEGQQYDMDFEKIPGVSIPEYLKMIKLKTAVLLGASLKIGAICADAGEQQAQLIYDFGVNIGMAFQLKDDYLDAFGDFEKFGKSIGGDIAANKKTWLYLKCQELANEEDRKQLLDYFARNEIDSGEKIKQVLHLYAKYEIKKHITAEMEKYFGKSLELMKKLNADTQRKNDLTSYAEWLYKRDH